MRSSINCVITLLAAYSLASSSCLLQAQSLTILGGLNPDLGHEMRNVALGISPNGKYVVGQADGQAFLWSQSSGIQGLGFLQTEISWIESSASGVSNDGQVVVGSSVASNGRFAPFRWTGESGMLSPLGLGIDGEGTGVSSSGDLLVGSRIVNNPATVAAEAFYWSSEQGRVDLGYLSGAATQWSRALGVSQNASVIVGESANAQSIGIGNNLEAFLWTEGGGMVGLGMLPGEVFSFASAVSPDGSVVVGGSGDRGFVWTALEGMLSLEELAGVTFSSATAVSADGSRIVGNSVVDNSQIYRSYATLWSRDNGTHFLEDFLIAANVDMNGWELLEANGISADGQIIVGTARKWFDNDQVDRGFIVDLRAVPEPSSALMALVSLTLLLNRRASLRLHD